MSGYNRQFVCVCGHPVLTIRHGLASAWKTQADLLALPCPACDREWMLRDDGIDANEGGGIKLQLQGVSLPVFAEGRSL